MLLSAHLFIHMRTPDWPWTSINYREVPISACSLYAPTRHNTTIERGGQGGGFCKTVYRSTDAHDSISVP